MKKITIYILIIFTIFQSTIINAKESKKEKIITIFPKINEKHLSDISFKKYIDKYIITYSERDLRLSVWDSKTKKLIKNYKDLIIGHMLHFNGHLYLIGKDITQLNLENLSLSTLMGSSSSFGEIHLSKDFIAVAEKNFNIQEVSYSIYDFKTQNASWYLINNMHPYDAEEIIYTNSKDTVFIKKADNSWVKVVQTADYQSKYTKLDNFKKEKVKKENDAITRYDLRKVLKYDEYFQSGIQKNNQFSELLKSKLKNKHLYKRSKYSLKNELNHEDYLEKLFLYNNKNKQKIYEHELISMSKFSCSFNTSSVKFLNKNLVVNYECSEMGEYNNAKYIFSLEGKFIGKVGSTKILKVYDDNFYIINEDSVEVLNDSMKTIKVLKNINSEKISYIDTDKNSYSIFYKDGVIDYFNSKSGRKEYTKYFFENNVEITLLKEGFIDGKGEFEKYLHFLDNKNKIYTINQFYDFFYRPDLVKLKLQGKDISQYTNGLTYQNALKNPPPNVDILKVENQDITVRKDKNEDINLSKDKTTIKFNISQVKKGGVGLIRVYQEGKLVKTIGEGEVQKQIANAIEELETKQLEEKASSEQKKYLDSMELIASKSINGTVNVDELIETSKIDDVTNKDGSYSINIPLKSGLNNIEIEAFNKTNTVTSLREKITINTNIPKKEPTVYAIVAGVNEFETSKRFSNLKYSQNDARAIKEVISKNIKGKVEVSYLVGKDLTKENIYKVVEEIKSRARLEDKVIFYISTHGKAIKGNLYLIPQNNKKAKNWIKFEEMFKKIQSINALEQIFVIDACESGKAKDIVSSIYDSKASVLAKSSGVHVLLATTKGTFAFEHPDPNIEHGVFTNNILKALDDKNTDKNNDRKISVIELSKVLRSEKYVTKHQYPVIRNIGQDTKIKDIE